MNKEEDGDEELSETEEAWESAKGGAGGEENVGKNRRMQTCPALRVHKKGKSQSYLNYYTLALA